MSDWHPMNTAPKDTHIDVLWENGSIESEVYWSDTRYCMLGAPNGSRGPGWLSTEAGNLPIDEEDGMKGWRIAP